MASLNSCSFIGNVGHIETKYTQSGDPVTKFSLAVNERYKDRDGNKQERTEWVNVTIFGKPAEIAERYVHKGDLLFVHGTLRTHQYEKGGEKRYFTEIICDNFQMCGGKQQDSKANEADAGDFNDDIPF